MITNTIKQEAVRLGACKKIDEINNLMSLSHILFTPQGREFCELHKFPTMQLWRKIQPHITQDMGVFVDFGDIKRTNDRNIALIGHTNADLNFIDNTVVHKVILMHGAKAVINASNYVVLLIVNIGDCEVVINKDKTVKVL